MAATPSASTSNLQLPRKIVKIKPVDYPNIFFDGTGVGQFLRRFDMAQRCASRIFVGPNI